MPRTTHGWLALIAAVLVLITVAVDLLALGLLGPAAVMAQSSRGGPLTIGPTCTHYTGAEVTIRVPRAGTVVVSATVGVGINHTFGLEDDARIVVATSGSDCALTNYTAFISVPPTLGTDPYFYETVPLLRPFPVSGPATVTFYVNGVMASGADSRDRFDSASLVAVFHSA